MLTDVVLVNAHSLEIRLTHSLITETDLMDVIQAINAQRITDVQEFTTVLDDRDFPPTVGFFLEIHGDSMGTAKTIIRMCNAHIL